jgi:hypothetical protein
MSGIHSDTMRNAIRDGATPGSPGGPKWARGCDSCRFGIISQPDLWSCGVSFFIARAMAMDLDGICYIVYCNCRAGQAAMAKDQDTRRGLNQMEDVGVEQGTDSHGNKGYQWTTTEPPDYIPGQWWAAVRKACEELVANVEREPVDVPVLEAV